MTALPHPALDRPETLDYDDISPETRFLRANPEVRYQSDRNSDLHELHFPRQNRVYARSITLSLAAPIYTSQGISSQSVDDVLPLAVRLFPGYQETIYGAEGVIVSKRTYAPLGSADDRSVLWQLECQAEGDRLLQIAVEIDWGEPLEQRMVDGLLVAQSNPGQARGIHAQQNAESTRVFGAAEGRPDRVVFPDESRAHLLYYVLVAGQVDLPLILTLSDVGEQMAWNGFLAQRDIERAFNLTQSSWQRVTQRGRVWTPDIWLNRTIDKTKQQAIGQIVRFREGEATADREVASLASATGALDLCDPARSRSLLDRLGHVATASGGRLPRLLVAHPGAPGDESNSSLIQSNSAYLIALAQHLRLHFPAAAPGEHYPAAKLCADRLVATRQEMAESQSLRSAFVKGLRAAVFLARMFADGVNEARWESEALYMAGGHLPAFADGSLPMLSPVAPSSYPPASCLFWRGSTLGVEPLWPGEWAWWALVDLPAGDGGLTLVWDGTTLHVARTPGPSGKAETSEPLEIGFAGPVRRHSRLRVLGAGEDDFDLHFRGDEGWLFRPGL